jgi:hypothetical protein
MSRSWIRALACAAGFATVLFGAVLPAAATSVTGTYTGKITYVDSGLTGFIDPNGTFSFDLTYEDSVADAVPELPVFAIYPNAGLASSGQVGGFHFTTGSGDISINTMSDKLVLAARYFAPFTTDLIPGFELQQVDFDFLAPNPGSDALPSPAILQSLLTSANITLMFGDSTGEGGFYYVVGTFSLDVVKAPLPAALPLFLSALGGLGWLGRRRGKGQALAAAA